MSTQHASHFVNIILRRNKSSRKYNQESRLKLSRTIMTQALEETFEDLEETRRKSGEAIQEVLQFERQLHQDAYKEFNRLFFSLIKVHREFL